MGPMRVLVTGFGPFPGVTLNPSEAAVDALQRRADTGRMPGLQVGTAVLPVDFTTIPGQIAEIMRLVRPQLVLCTGVDMGAEAITVERVAINLLDARVPDIKGAQPVDQPVVPGAPDGLFATIPVKAVRRAIQQSGAPAELSLSAGTYGCNALMFAALHHAPPGTRVGFLHIPSLRVMGTATCATALAAAVQACVEHETDLDEVGGELA